jgi:hypothetical protein
MQNSSNFEIIAAAIELFNKYLIQRILLSQLFKSFDVPPIAQIIYANKV